MGLNEVPRWSDSIQRRWRDRVDDAVARVVTLTSRGRRAEGDLLAAKELMAAERWAEAATALIGARRHPLARVGATADLALGAILVERLGRRVLGIRALERAWRSRHPSVAPLAAFRLAVLLHQDGDGQRARRMYRWAWRRGQGSTRWDSISALVALAREAHDVSTALRLLAELEREAGMCNSADAWQALGSLQEQARTPALAETSYRKALACEPSDVALVHGLLGRTLARQGKDEAARAELELATARATPAWPFVFLLARVNERLGNTAAACAGYDDVVGVSDSEAGNSLSWAGVGEATAADLRPIAAVRLGRLRESMDDAGEARVAYGYAAEHGTTSISAAAWFALARLERSAGNRSAARAAYARAMVVKGGSYPAAELGLAELLIASKQYGTARQMLESLRTRGDTRVASLAAVQLGELLTALGELAAARASYEAALAGPLRADVRTRVEQALNR